MKIPIIKSLVEKQDMANLQAAEIALLNEEPLNIEIGGDDEGEQLTHVMAAIWIKHQMQHNNVEFLPALRKYTERVRTSIS